MSHHTTSFSIRKKIITASIQAHLLKLFRFLFVFPSYSLYKEKTFKTHQDLVLTLPRVHVCQSKWVLTRQTTQQIMGWAGNGERCHNLSLGRERWNMSNDGITWMDRENQGLQESQGLLENLRLAQRLIEELT